MFIPFEWENSCVLFCRDDVIPVIIFLLYVFIKALQMRKRLLGNYLLSRDIVFNVCLIALRKSSFINFSEIH